MLNGTSCYKDKAGLPLHIRAAFFPVYNDLCMIYKRENLSKCLHGRTQNRKESFNEMIWNRLLKANHVGIDILSLGVYDAIAHFNDGTTAFLEILKDMNIEPGDHMMKGLQIQDEFVQIHVTYLMSEPQLKRRKITRHCTKIRMDQFTKQGHFQNE